MTDDVSDEEMERRMSAKLFGGDAAKPTIAVRKKSRRLKPPLAREVIELRFIAIIDASDDETMWWVVEQLGPKGWFELETYDTRRSAVTAAEKYAAAGDKITWWQRRQ